jgi:glutamate synthase domain-containing protein 1
MCGIVGLFLKDPDLQPQLGAMLAAMLGTMDERGPDSAGFAVFSSGEPGHVRLTLRASADYDFAHLDRLLAVPIEVRGNHAVLSCPAAREAAIRQEIAALAPRIAVVGAGQRMQLFKDVGRPNEVAERFGLAAMGGSHGIGHTRMATESAVTIDGAHPYTTGPDQCLVHNGSLSNHNAMRRRLRREGLQFSTENDSEVAAGYLTWRMQQGRTLGEALGQALDDLDGFYTFVVGTQNGFGVLRDPIACKPAVMAETGRYVAFGSEYRALVDLPGIDQARLFEPEPGEVYFWNHQI